MDVVSLFSGCGGTDLGIEQGGHDIVWANDIDAWACASYKENMKLTPACSDIRKVPDFPKADLLVGCYPCQGFSLYGPRRKDDPRNFLYKEYARALGQTHPRYFLAENVKGLLSGYGKDIFKDMVADFKRKGYVVDWRLINAKDYGIPQDRERVFIVGVRKDLAKKYDFPEKTHGPGLKGYVTLRKAIGGLPAPKRSEYWIGDFSSHYMSRNRKRGWDEVSFTIQASGRHAPLHPRGRMPVNVGKDKYIFPKNSYQRRLSVRECARIQSFPDHFEFMGPLAAQYAQIGNAVPPKLARIFAETFE